MFLLVLLKLPVPGVGADMQPILVSLLERTFAKNLRRYTAMANRGSSTKCVLGLFVLCISRGLGTGAD